MIIANKMNFLISKESVKESIENLLNDFRENKIKGHPFGWSVYKMGIYGFNDNISTYLLYEGQGVPEALYNSNYDWDIDLTEDAEEYAQFDNLEEGKDFLNNVINFTLDKIEENLI